MIKQNNMCSVIIFSYCLILLSIQNWVSPRNKRSEPSSGLSPDDEVGGHFLEEVDRMPMIMPDAQCMNTEFNQCGNLFIHTAESGLF